MEDGAVIYALRVIVIAPSLVMQYGWVESDELECGGLIEHGYN